MIVSYPLLKNPYYSPFLLPETILIYRLFPIFAYGYKHLGNYGKKKKITNREIPVQTQAAKAGRRAHLPIH